MTCPSLDHLGLDEPGDPRGEDDDVGAGHDVLEARDLDASLPRHGMSELVGVGRDHGLRPCLNRERRDAEARGAKPDLADDGL